MLAISQRSIILYCEVSAAAAAYDHLIQWKREPQLEPIFARQGTFLPYIHPDYEGKAGQKKRGTTRGQKLTV